MITTSEPSFGDQPDAAEVEQPAEGQLDAAGVLARRLVVGEEPAAGHRPAGELDADARRRPVAEPRVQPAERALPSLRRRTQRGLDADALHGDGERPELQRACRGDREHSRRGAARSPASETVDACRRSGRPAERRRAPGSRPSPQRRPASVTPVRLDQAQARRRGPAAARARRGAGRGSRRDPLGRAPGSRASTPASSLISSGLPLASASCSAACGLRRPPGGCRPARPPASRRGSERTAHAPPLLVAPDSTRTSPGRSSSATPPAASIAPDRLELTTSASSTSTASVSLTSGGRQAERRRPSARRARDRDAGRARPRRP